MSQYDDLFDTLAGPQIAVSFGDAVTYTPLGGEARSITASTLRQCSPSFDEHGQELRIERLEVEVERDAEAGIDAPRIGDQIVLPAGKDADARPYVWRGEVLHVSDGRWTLIYQRPLRTGDSGRA